MRIDPFSLELFLIVIETGSISAAAGRLHLDATAASRRIGELEKRFGTRLLVRTNRGVAATDAGLELSGLSRRVIGHLDALTQRMGRWSQGQQGRVRIQANLSALAQHLPDPLARYALRHPEVQVRIVERLSGAIVEAVLNDEADIGVCVPPTHPASLQVLPYRLDRLGVVLPLSHPLASHTSVRFAEILAEPQVGLDEGSSIETLLNRAALALRSAPNVRVQVPTYEMLRDLVEAGVGIGVVPAGVAGPWARAGRVALRPLQEPWAARTLSIVCRQRAELSAATDALVEFLLGTDRAAGR